MYLRSESMRLRSEMSMIVRSPPFRRPRRAYKTMGLLTAQNTRAKEAPLPRASCGRRGKCLECRLKGAFLPICYVCSNPIFVRYRTLIIPRTRARVLVPDGALSASNLRFDHPIGAGRERRRAHEAKRLCGRLVLKWNFARLLEANALGLPP